MFNTTSGVQTYPFGNSSTCMYKKMSGNQTNLKGTTCSGCTATSCASSCTLNNQPMTIANAACSQTSYQATNSAIACSASGSNAFYPQGINPVPAGVSFQGVVFYASSNTHMYLMDPFYPYASIWVYGASCVGFVDGVAVGMMVQITLPVTANFIISGPTYDAPAGMLGLGGGFDQAAYGGAADNEWVLALNMAPYNASASGAAMGVQNYAAGTVTAPALCPGMTLLSSAEAWPYEPVGGAYTCTASAAASFTNGVDLTQPLVPASTTFLAAPPPPPMEDFALPAAITLPQGCLSVYQFLCSYTSGNVGNNVTAPYSGTGSNAGWTAPSGSLCGVWYFGTGTGNACASPPRALHLLCGADASAPTHHADIQDPFFPYASVWIAGATSAVAVSTNADGSKDSLNIGADPGFAPGQYLKYAYSNALIQLARAAGTPIFQLSLSGLAYNNATCDYRTVTVASCPPSNCQLATCNSRNIQSDYGADYCTGQPVVGQTPATTVGCGIQVLATGWPIIGPAPPANSPLLNTGATQCLDNVAAIPLGFTGVLYFQSTIAIGGYSASTFPAVSSMFTQYVATALSLPAGNVTIVAGGITNTPASLYIGRRLMSQQFVSVTYQVAITTALSANARTFMSSAAGAAFSNALVSGGLTLTTSVELLSAPVLTGTSSATVYVYSAPAPASKKSYIALGLGLGIGLGGGLIILLGLVYAFVLKKKNIEQGQKSAVMMVPAMAAAPATANPMAAHK